MLTRITPSGISPPGANYSHATHVPANARWLFVSGQVGKAADGTVPEDAAAQAEICFRNMEVILAAADMTPADLVRLNTYLVDRHDGAAYMAVRDRFVRSPPPASTLLIISGLTDPRYRIEIEALAAKV
jgi:enamine deaminase RidA (YjgF/YER057c/UK114 family)